MKQVGRGRKAARPESRPRVCERDTHLYTFQNQKVTPIRQVLRTWRWLGWTRLDVDVGADLSVVSIS
jgi:hypothetical protein